MASKGIVHFDASNDPVGVSEGSQAVPIEIPVPGHALLAKP
jgi:hypothetical protein